jgi:hypothetical protein
VVGNCDVVLAMLRRGQPNMASCLAGDLVTEPLQMARKSRPERSRGSLTPR